MPSLAIVGYRAFYDFTLLKRHVDQFIFDFEYSIDTIVSGGATGADTLAKRYASERGLKFVVYEAEWNVYGKAAGPIRNKKIVEASDAVIAFLHPDSVGTKHTIKIANSDKRKIKVVVVNV